jgi:hypothetical protein
MHWLDCVVLCIMKFMILVLTLVPRDSISPMVPSFKYRLMRRTYCLLTVGHQLTSSQTSQLTFSLADESLRPLEHQSAVSLLR